MEKMRVLDFTEKDPRYLPDHVELVVPGTTLVCMRMVDGTLTCLSETTWREDIGDEDMDALLKISGVR